MELKTFVSQTIEDIVGATNDATEKLDRYVGIKSHTQDMKTSAGAISLGTIHFDIAVTVESKNSSGGKAVIKVLELIGSEGHLSKETQNATVSRIKFAVNVSSITFTEGKKRTDALYKNSRQ